jgi:SMI1/KNR4 family protein SUKH-1
MRSAAELAFPPGTSAGPLDPDWCLKVEERIGRPFDTDFLAFLFEQNGGPPAARLLTVAGKAKVLERFLCLVDPQANPAEAIYDVGAVWAMLKGRLQPTLVPFAVLFPGDFLCFDYAAPGPPAVVWWKHEAPAGAGPAAPVPVAPDFPGLLAMLQTESR